MSFPRMLIGELFIALWVWIVPAVLAAGLTALLIEPLQLIGFMPWYLWVLLSPLLYLFWLICFLFFCGKTIAGMGRKNPKPRYAVLPGAPKGKMSTVIASALRLVVVKSLPLVRLLETSGWGRRLVILSYSPSLHIGKGAQINGILEDPDLTELGERVVLGAGVAIGAHFWNTLRSGKRIYVTAPVKIGARATIGAYSLVSLGCRIGEDSIIEPHSYLLPHTEVPAGEIWGGRPAVFIKNRSPREMASTVEAGQ